jgi:hypothetical protein
MDKPELGHDGGALHFRTAELTEHLYRPRQIMFE